MFGFITKGLSSVTKLAAGVSGASDIAGSLGIGKDSKDPGRLAANGRALADAQRGDAGAVAYLKGRSGRFGKVAHSWAGDKETPVGGWATQPTKDDAYNKWLVATGQAPATAGAVPLTSFPPPVFPSSTDSPGGLPFDKSKAVGTEVVPAWMWGAAAAGLVAVLLLAAGDGRRR